MLYTKKNVFCVRILAIVKLSSASFNVVSLLFLLLRFFFFFLSFSQLDSAKCDLCSESNHKKGQRKFQMKSANIKFCVRTGIITTIKCQRLNSRREFTRPQNRGRFERVDILSMGKISQKKCNIVFDGGSQMP